MAKPAMAQEAICALRREIARIEGVLPERLEHDDGASRKPHPAPACGTRLASGAAGLDAALGGGLPGAGLVEIVGAQSRDAAAAAGFALALAALVMAARARHGAPRQASEARPGNGRNDPALLWIGLSGLFAETGFPYAPGLETAFGLPASSLLFSQASRLADVLWIAEEAARFGGFPAIILELHGNPSRLDLTATRRLHRRAVLAGRPLFLLRQAARPEPTAAPVRLLVAPAPSALRRTLAGLLPQSIGPPSVSVTVDKSPGRPAGPFHLEWNRHDLAFQESRPEDSGALVPASFVRPRAAPQARAVLALAKRRAG